MHSPIMMSKIAACVGVGLLALGLSVAVGEPAWALKPPVDDGGGGGTYPDPDDGPPTPTPVRRLQSFDVRTDSVVATATIAYNGDPGAATVTWGDGTSTARCLPGQEGPLHSGCLPDPYAGQPSGELVFQHRYAAPANGASFTVAITGQVGNESKTIAIGVTPRYRVTVTDVQFSPLNHCDTVVEEETEWKVNRGVNGLVPDHEWNFERVTNPPAVVGDWLPKFEAIAGSGVAVDLRASDHPRVYLHATELDPVFDQDVTTRSVDLNPLLGDRSMSVTSEQEDTDPLIPDELCQVEYRFDIRVKVLTPGLDSGPGAGQ